MDRFALQFSLGYISPEDEVEILSSQLQQHPIDQVKPCLTQTDIVTLKQQVKQIRVSDELKRYIVDIVSATRKAEGVQLGASPRGAIALMKLTQALALFDGYEFVLPEHVQEIARPVLAHRLVLEPQARFSGRTADAVIRDVLNDISVPT